MGVRQGVAMNSLKFHQGPPCPALLQPAVRPPLITISGGAASKAGGLRPSSAPPHAVRLCFSFPGLIRFFPVSQQVMQQQAAMIAAGATPNAAAAAVAQAAAAAGQSTRASMPVVYFMGCRGDPWPHSMLRYKNCPVGGQPSAG
jgi:hypothetical protein